MPWAIRRYRYRGDVDCAEPIAGWVGRCCMLVSPHDRLARKPGLGGLGMLLASIEAIQAVRGHEPDQHEPPNLAQHLACGAPSVRSVDVAVCDRQKVFGFDPGDIADMRGRAAYLPGA